jgi:hypothetical protein
MTNTVNIKWAAMSSY